MRVGYFECGSGASGDMILGALVDAGVAVEALVTELAKLGVPGYRVSAREVKRGAFRATKLDVEIERGVDHGHRSLRDVLAILEGSRLQPGVVKRAADIFTRLAEAEARAHGTTRDDVHFHDVGAIDAIVDVTGSVIALALLGIEEVRVSPLAVGRGVVNGPHGTMPIPAPGTAELLRGVPVSDPGIEAELLTPTGAAILTTLAAGFGAMPAMTVTAVGYGAGSRDLREAPNVLRCFVGEQLPSSPEENVVQLETTIDDMSPQLYEPLMDRLFAAGALDVYLTAVVMKRGRPGVVVTALCPPALARDLARVLFEESTTIGVRWSEWRRIVLDREIVQIETAYGRIPFKVSRLDGRIVTVTPEFADAARIARETSKPVREVLEQARADARRQLRD